MKVMYWGWQTNETEVASAPQDCGAIREGWDQLAGLLGKTQIAILFKPLLFECVLITVAKAVF